METLIKRAETHPLSRNHRESDMSHDPLMPSLFPSLSSSESLKNGMNRYNYLIQRVIFGLVGAKLPNPH